MLSDPTALLTTAEEVRAALELVLPYVLKPARYTGGELNSVTRDHATARVRVALAFPDTYEIGMSNLAIAILYDIVNRRDAWLVERTFAPWTDMEERMRTAGIPLFGLETGTPVRDFDLLGFSLAHELCYTNILSMLDLAGIPLRTADRTDSRYPLVIAGGHCAFSPEPLAPFVDAFVLGEGEEVFVQVLEDLESAPNMPLAERLRRLARLRGVYVPSLYEPQYAVLAPCEWSHSEERFAGADLRVLSATRAIDPAAPDTVERAIIADADSLPYPLKPVVPFIEAVHDRIALEVMRGCTRGCRFCQAGMITRPVREKSAGTLVAQATELVDATGHEDICLISLSTADYSQVQPLVAELTQEFGHRGIGISLPSLRADRDCVQLAAEIQKVRKSGLTFAPEAGTQRLRDSINKGVTEESLMDAVAAAFDAGWRRVKLYFMFGLPTETDEDVVAIAELSNRVARVGRNRRITGLAVGVGVSAFVPKPHTPFQWRSRDTAEQLARKEALLRSRIRDRAIDLRFHNPESTQLEAALARGDRRVAEAIEIAWRNGARFDAWGEHFRYDVWMDAFAAAGLDPGFFANRQRPYEEVQPWDHLASGVSRGYMRAEDKRATAGIPTGDCHDGPCTFCQACDRWLTERSHADAS